MKNIIALSILFASLGATAQVSKNYESISVNTDGSFSIVRPKFKDPEGNGDMRISIRSDVNGVCKRYGFDTFVANSVIPEPLCPTCQSTKMTSVQLNSEGRFEEFAVDKYAAEPSAILYISCRKSTDMIPVNTQTGTRTNDDGTTTLVRPAFTMNGLNYRLHTTNNLNDVCRSFGFIKAVAKSMRSEALCPTCSSTRMTSVNINAQGAFSHFSLDSYASAADSIRSVICE